MQHKTFRILSLSTLVIIISLACVYNYCITKKFDIGIILMLKSSPLFMLITLNASYVFIYRITLYSFGLLVFLILCLVGDFFMALYSNQFIYLIAGGSFFLTARILLIFILAFNIQYSLKTILLSHIGFSIIFIILGILNIVREPTTISILTSVYIILGFGIPLSYSYLRIGALNQESKMSSLFAFLGILIFNISDLLLFICIFTDKFPSYVILISNNIYWLGIYLITISVVRSSEEYIEKGNVGI